jgi:hypothetical protein
VGDGGGVMKVWQAWIRQWQEGMMARWYRQDGTGTDTLADGISTNRRDDTDVRTIWLELDKEDRQGRIDIDDV